MYAYLGTQWWDSEYVYDQMLLLEFAEFAST